MSKLTTEDMIEILETRIKDVNKSYFTTSADALQGITLAIGELFR